MVFWLRSPPPSRTMFVYFCSSICRVLSELVSSSNPFLLSPTPHPRAKIDHHVLCDLHFPRKPIGEQCADEILATSLAWPEIISAGVRPVGDVEITLPNSQGNQSFRSVAGKRSSGRAVYLGDPRLALLGRSPGRAEKSCASRRLAQSPQVLYFLGKCRRRRQRSRRRRTRTRCRLQDCAWISGRRDGPPGS